MLEISGNETSEFNFDVNFAYHRCIDMVYKY